VTYVEEQERMREYSGRYRVPRSRESMTRAFARLRSERLSRSHGTVSYSLSGYLQLLKADLRAIWTYLCREEDGR
jgi:hypothetical protein